MKWGGDSSSYNPPYRLVTVKDVGNYNCETIYTEANRVCTISSLKATSKEIHPVFIWDEYISSGNTPVGMSPLGKISYTVGDSRVYASSSALTFVFTDDASAKLGDECILIENENYNTTLDGYTCKKEVVLEYKFNPTSSVEQILNSSQSFCSKIPYENGTKFNYGYLPLHPNQGVSHISKQNGKVIIKDGDTVLCIYHTYKETYGKKWKGVLDFGQLRAVQTKLQFELNIQNNSVNEATYVPITFTNFSGYCECVYIKDRKIIAIEGGNMGLSIDTTQWANALASPLPVKIPFSVPPLQNRSYDTVYVTSANIFKYEPVIDSRIPNYEYMKNDTFEVTLPSKFEKKLIISVGVTVEHTDLTYDIEIHPIMEIIGANQIFSTVYPNGAVINLYLDENYCVTIYTNSDGTVGSFEYDEKRFHEDVTCTKISEGKYKIVGSKQFRYNVDDVTISPGARDSFPECFEYKFHKEITNNDIPVTPPDEEPPGIIISSHNYDRNTGTMHVVVENNTSYGAELVCLFSALPPNFGDRVLEMCSFSLESGNTYTVSAGGPSFKNCSGVTCSLEFKDGSVIGEYYLSD